MTTIMLLLLAASLPSAIRAQNTEPLPATGSAQTTPPPRAQSDSLDDDPLFQRLSPEVQARIREMTTRINTAIEQGDFKALEQILLEGVQRGLTGTKFCGENVVNDGTRVDASAYNEPHRAVAVRWLGREPGTAVHTAIFTDAGRCVVKDGDTLEGGKAILSVMPNSLAVSNKHGLVAFEAEWTSPSGRSRGGAAHRGLFIENRWVGDLDPHKASAPFSLTVNERERDFWWNDENETLEMKHKVVLMASSQAACGLAKKPRLGGIPLPSFVAKVLGKTQNPTQNPCPSASASGQGAKQ